MKIGVLIFVAAGFALAACSSADLHGSDDTIRQSGLANSDPANDNSSENYRDNLYRQYRKDGLTDQQADNRATEATFFNDMNNKAAPSSR